MNPSLAKYHPVRFQRYMSSFFDQTVSEFQARSEADRERYRGLLFSSIMEDRLQEMVESNASALPEDVTTSPEGWTEFVSSVVDAYRDYDSSGQNVFEIQPQLLEMLKHTDVDDLTFCQMQFPFTCFYIYWGKGSQIKLWTNEHRVDGCYITNATFPEHPKEPLLWITFTSVNQGSDFTQDKPVVGFLADERFYTLRLALHENKTVGLSLEEAIQEEHESPEYRRLVAEQWLEYLPDLTRLALNCMCYLNYSKRDVEFRYPDETPGKLIAKLERSNKPKDKARNQSKLESMGFRKVFVCGSNAQKQGAVGTGREVSPHWRRGHWRNQAHGPERKSHRLIWIHPTLVRKDKGEPAVGHLYSFEEEHKA